MNKVYRNTNQYVLHLCVCHIPHDLIAIFPHQEDRFMGQHVCKYVQEIQERDNAGLHTISTPSIPFPFPVSAQSPQKKRKQEQKSIICHIARRIKGSCSMVMSRKYCGFVSTSLSLQGHIGTLLSEISSSQLVCWRLSYMVVRGIRQIQRIQVSTLARTSSDRRLSRRWCRRGHVRAV